MKIVEIFHQFCFQIECLNEINEELGKDMGCLRVTQQFALSIDILVISVIIMFHV